MHDQTPTIGVTMGDPGGIGAEVVIKALADPDIRRLGRFVIFGLNELVTYAADLAEIDAFWYRDQHENLRRYPHRVVVADYDDWNYPSAGIHQPTREGGLLSGQLVIDAVEAVRNNHIDAIVTAPICKHSWKLAGFKYTGHTTMLADLFKSRQVTMMFAGGPLKVALASIHVGLFDLRNQFTIGLVFQPIDLLHQALVNWFGIPEPRIAVAGLNPHAGEEGQFGDEEERIIAPAITMAQQAGINVEGPFPADTVFWQALQGRYHAVVAMYHDQGLIPVKLLAFDTSVNLTLGLPTIRTSVDHGTAYDIAGHNKANPGSMKAALKMACELVRKSQESGTPRNNQPTRH